MLHLTTPTDSGWFERIKAHMPTLMLDHTHLEKRAASTALSMIFRYTEKPSLAMRLSHVVREEMEHFERMLKILEQRQIPLVRLEPAPYAAKLAAHARKKDPEALLDKLLIAALIEARSCERFQILAQNLEDQELATLYDQLYQEEARHYTLYIQIARELFPHELVNARLDQLSQEEAQAIELSRGEPRLHCF